MRCISSPATPGHAFGCYTSWVGGNSTLHAVEVTNPTDYAEIFQLVDSQLASIVRIPRTNDVELASISVLALRP